MCTKVPLTKDATLRVIYSQVSNVWSFTSTPLFLFYRCNCAVRLSPLTLWHCMFLLHQINVKFLWNDADSKKIKSWDRKLPHATLTIKLLALYTEPLDYDYEVGLGAMWNETYIIAVCSLQMRGADSCSVVAAESVQVNIKHACLCIVCVVVCSCRILFYFLSHVCFGAWFVCCYLCVCRTKILL